MALLVAEGFDDFPVDYLNKKYNWSGAVITAHQAGDSLAGRYHGKAIACLYGTVEKVWTLPANQSEIYAALAVRRSGEGSFGASTTVLAFRDGSAVQVDLRSPASGADLQVTRNGTVLASIPNALPLNVWVWLSIRVLIHAANGVVEVKDAGGGSLLNLTGANTQATANAYANNVRLYGENIGPDLAWDDLFLMDTAASTFNCHLTERAIRTLFPTADGALAQWSPHGAPNRWDCVDEQSPDEDTTYLSSASAGAVNLCQLSDLAPGEAGIEAVIVQHRSRKDDVGARSVRGLLTSGGTTSPGSAVSLATSYATFADLWETDPATGLAFSPAAVNALEAGLETA